MAFFSHQRDTDARSSTRVSRSALVAAPIAVLATAGAVTLGIVLQGSASTAPSTANAGTSVASAASTPVETPSESPSESPAAPDPASSGVAAPAPAAGAPAPGTPARPDIVSRSAARMGPVVVKEREPGLLSEKLTRRALRQADTRLWTTTELNLWTTPGESAEGAGLLESAKQVLVTGREKWGRVEVVVGGRPQWVTEGYLSTEEPVETGAAAGLSMAPCASSSPESGLTDKAVYVYRSVCNAFPEITTYGGYANRGSEHSTGGAIDIMTSDVELGTAIAEFLRANFVELSLDNIIYRQEILSGVRAGEGWRFMSDRGSATANHYDHVHVFAR